MILQIPNYKSVEIKNIVLDYNGTIAKDGVVKKNVKNYIEKLSEYNIYVLTADTHGSAKKNLQNLNINLTILKSNNHAKEKAEFVKNLKNVIAIGNGSNDALMLKEADIGICVIEDEGASVKSIITADIVTKSIEDAFEMIINPKRLIATLRE